MLPVMRNNILVVMDNSRNHTDHYPSDPHPDGSKKCPGCFLDKKKHGFGTFKWPSDRQEFGV